MDDLVRRARDFLVGVSKGPWAYRPQEFDDWGYVRQADPDADGWRHFICQVKSPMLSDDGLNDCRKRGIDPWGRDAKFIAASRDLIPAMSDRIEALTADNERLQARVAVLEDALRPFSDMAGEMFARNWNRDGVAISFVTPDGPMRLTFNEFLNASAALKETSDD